MRKVLLLPFLLLVGCLPLFQPPQTPTIIDSTAAAGVVVTPLVGADTITITVQNVAASELSGPPATSPALANVALIISAVPLGLSSSYSPTDPLCRKSGEAVSCFVPGPVASGATVGVSFGYQGDPGGLSTVSVFRANPSGPPGQYLRLEASAAIRGP